MKVLSTLLSIIIFATLWSPFFVVIIANEANPDLFNVIICFETAAFSFYNSIRFKEWFDSNLK